MAKIENPSASYDHAKYLNNNNNEEDSYQLDLNKYKHTSHDLGDRAQYSYVYPNQLDKSHEAYIERTGKFYKPLDKTNYCSIYTPAMIIYKAAGVEKDYDLLRLVVELNDKNNKYSYLLSSPNPKDVDAAQNHIDEVCQSLKSLDLSGHKLDAIPDELKNFTNLGLLDLQGNLLEPDVLVDYFHDKDMTIIIDQLIGKKADELLASKLSGKCKFVYDKAPADSTQDFQKLDCPKIENGHLTYVRKTFNGREWISYGREWIS